MPTELENLQTSAANIASLIATITASPKPTYNVDGQSVSWGEYLQTLIEQKKNLDKLIQYVGRNESDAKPTSTDYKNEWRDNYERSGLLDSEVGEPSLPFDGFS